MVEGLGEVIGGLLEIALEAGPRWMRTGCAAMLLIVVFGLLGWVVGPWK